MPTDDLEFPACSVLLSILRPGPSEPEVEFDDFVTRVRVRLAPADEDSGPVLGMRMATQGGTRVFLLMLTPKAAAELAFRIARAIVEAKEE
jgi:hypothetical protein